MDWAAQVDNYCERLGPGLWEEPINALTNLVFVAVAFVVLPRIRGDRGAIVLSLMAIIIGICAVLFHTLATQWAGLADTLSILVFILMYIFVAMQRALGKDRAIALLVVLAFIPYAVIVERFLGSLVGSLNGSVEYFPVLMLIFIFGMLSKDPATRKGFWIGAALLAVSLFFRSIDEAVCSVIPLGTHFIWHIVNSVLLGWMILVIHNAVPDRPRSGVARG